MADKALVIVESPTKARTISQFLGSGYRVMASVGHVVDLPQSGLCVDVDDNFKLTYEVTKKDVIRELKAALKDADRLYLATDEDREGEAIAWHLREQLRPKVPTQRMVFHEITRTAIAEAVKSSRDINTGLVDAQETRRTLDRLYGYQVSPVLWRKVKTGLSAGRVQSPAIRLIVERERERMAFTSASYWSLTAHHPTKPDFESTLWSLNGRRVAEGRDFGQQGNLANSEVVKLDEAAARGLADSLVGKSLTLASADTKAWRSSPKPPFITSTLQQEGGRKLNMSAQQVMRAAQSLYENGYITYMRTDSTSLSQAAVSAARAQISELYGAQYLSPAPRQFSRKVKNAQEAHEAVRPAGESFAEPQVLKAKLNPAEFKLYEMIWKRTLACQMADAQGESLSLRLRGETQRKEAVEFAASGRTVTFEGYLKAYEESTDERDAGGEEERALPELKVGETVLVDALKPAGHQTQPRARFTEASLVKRLEELGIGRPSTYASILGTLQAKYIWKKGQALVPNWPAFAVVALMEKHFEDLVDFAFTAELEEDLDEIASGDRDRVTFLKDFYFGAKGHIGLKQQVTQNIDNIDAAAVNSILLGRDEAGVEVVVKPGRYGPYIKRGEDTVALNENLAPDEVTVAKALAMLRAPKSDEPLGVDPVTSLKVYVKQGRFGPFVQLGEMDKVNKPKTQSLLSQMKADTLTLEQALSLLRLPRVVGTSADGEIVTAQNGRYGPYLMKGKESRNLGSADDGKLFTVTLEEAEALFSQPKQFRGKRPARPPLKELGKDLVSGRDIVVKEGRFGPYVTDGETIASLRRGDAPADLTTERAGELLQLRREYMASPEGQAHASRRGKRGARGAPRGKPIRKTGTAKATASKVAARPRKRVAKG